jgi:hypothetical protein
VSGLQKLVSLFASPFLRAWNALAKAVAERGTIRAPKNCQLQGYLVGIRKRRRDRDGKIERGELILSENEDDGVKYATKTRSPQLAPSPPIPVWRQTWPDNGRKSKRHAQA